MKILLVEDNELLAKGLIYSLEQKRLHCNSYCRYKWNIKNNRKERIDIAILDISLPDGNGFDLYKNYIKEKKFLQYFLLQKTKKMILWKD